MSESEPERMTDRNSSGRSWTRGCASAMSNNSASVNPISGPRSFVPVMFLRSTKASVTQYLVRPEPKG